jgi:hypothetical protein
MILNIPKTIAITLLSLSILPSAHADRSWDDANSPSNFDASYIRDFNQLPLRGEMDQSGKRGWADSYWPKVKGSIANRWQVPGSNYKEDKSPSYFQLSRMSDTQIDLLSPAEKFDLARGKISFPIATKIRKDFKEKEKDWRGICNGWTHASLNYAEPNPIVYIEPNSKRKIPFGSSDIKALLAHFHANLDESGAKYIGRSCRPGSRFLLNFNGACSDVHPAALHIMMANEMGIRHQGFAADRDPSVQVWNQPFVKFESRIDDIKTRDLSKKATEGTRKEVYITSTLTYVNELYNTEDPLLEDADHSAPSYTPVLATQKYRTIEYKYVLELNFRDRIIGGEWISDMRPDLIWKQDFKLPGLVRDEDNKKDDWSLLSELVKIATQSI